MKKLMFIIAALISGSLFAETLTVDEDMTFTEADSLAGYDAINVSQGATLTFNIAEGFSLEVPCPLNGKGSVVKTGKGEVDYTYVNTAKLSVRDYYIEYPGGTTINEGQLKLPQNYPSGSPNYTYSAVQFGRMIVNKGGTLYLADHTQTHIEGLWGDGEVTSKSTSGVVQLYLVADKGAATEEYHAPSKFCGLISGTIRQRASDGKSDIMSTDNTNSGDMALGNGCSVGIAKFGNQNQPGSLGTSKITMRGSQGAVRYLGEGETATRQFSIGSGADQIEIDAGEKGNLVLSGGTTVNNGAATAKFVLSGDNGGECVYSGEITKSSSTSVTLVKKGSGTWKVTNTESAIDAISVEAGILDLSGWEALPQVEVNGGKIYVDDSDFEIGDVLFTVQATSTLDKDGVALKRESLDYSVKVETEGEIKKVVLCSKYDYYVQLTRSDALNYAATDPERFSYSYLSIGGWSDGCLATDDKDYYVGSDRRLTLLKASTLSANCYTDRGKGSGAYWEAIVFFGRSLTVAGEMYISGDASSYGYAFKIPKLIMLDGSKITFPNNYAQDSYLDYQVKGETELKVESTSSDNPFTIYNTSVGGRFLRIGMNLAGEEDAVMAIVNQNPSGSGVSEVQLLGSGRGYKGLLKVGNNERLAISNSDGFAGRIKLEGNAKVDIDVSKLNKNCDGYDSPVFAFVTDSARIPDNVTFRNIGGSELKTRYDGEKGVLEAWVRFDRIPAGSANQYLIDNGFVYKTVDEYLDTDEGSKYIADAVDNNGSGKRYSSIVRPGFWMFKGSSMGDEFIEGDYVTSNRIFFNDYDYGEFVGRSLTFWGAGANLRADLGTTFYCEDLRFQNGYIFNAGGGNKTITLGGKVTIIGSSCFRSSARPNTKDVLKIDAKFCGDAEAVYTVVRGSDDRTGVKELQFNGDCSEYHGTVKLENGEEVIKFGNGGFDNGTIEIGGNGGRIEISDTAQGTVLIRKLVIAESGRVAIVIPEGKSLLIQEMDRKSGAVIEKTGAGALIPSFVRDQSWENSNVPAGKALGDNGGNGLPYWQSYVLGLDPADATSKPLVNKRKASDGKLKLGLDNVTVNTASGVTPKFTLKESTDNSTFAAVGAAQTESEFEIDLPKDDKVKYFKIEYSFE